MPKGIYRVISVDIKVLTFEVGFWVMGGERDENIKWEKYVLQTVL